MAKYKRQKTKYPGVYFIEAIHIASGKPEKVFYIRYRREGKTIEEKAGRQKQDNMSAAKASRIRATRIDGETLSNNERRAANEAERLREQNKWTLNRIWEEYKRQRAENKSLKTDDSRFNKHIAPALGQKEPTELITLDADRLRIALLKEKSPQTVKHIMALLKRTISFGVKKGLCKQPEPSQLNIELPKVDNKKTEDLTPDQIKALLKAIDEDPSVHVGNMMKMALYTGMRRGELFRLKWSDIDFNKGFIHILAPKGGQDQKIPMNDAARAVLLAHERTDSPHVFPGRNGGMRVDAIHQANRIKESAGLPKSFRPFHGLRHVYASTLASSGKIDMYTLQKLLTHKKPEMTQRYAHLRDEALQRASDTASEIFAELESPQEERKVISLSVNKD